MALGAARLDLQTTLVTHCAEDRYGLLADQHLQANSVRVINGGTLPTSTALAALHTERAAQYTFSIDRDINGASLPVHPGRPGPAVRREFGPDP